MYFRCFATLLYILFQENETDSDWIPKTVAEHVARIRDIELLTGVNFQGFVFRNPDSFDSVVRFRLRLPQFTSQWLNDFLIAVPPTSSVDDPLNTTTTAIAETTSTSSTFTATISLVLPLVVIWLLFT